MQLAKRQANRVLFTFFIMHLFGPIEFESVQLPPFHLEVLPIQGGVCQNQHPVTLALVVAAALA
jgi:hypothetical protein